MNGEPLSIKETFKTNLRYYFGGFGNFFIAFFFALTLPFTFLFVPYEDDNERNFFGFLTIVVALIEIAIVWGVLFA